MYISFDDDPRFVPPLRVVAGLIFNQDLVAGAQGRQITRVSNVVLHLAQIAHREGSLSVFGHQLPFWADTESLVWER